MGKQRAEVISIYENAFSKPPKHLSKESKKFFSDLVRGYDRDEAAVELLRLACEALDRVREARRIIKKNGMMLKLRGGGSKAHPMLAVEKDSRIASARLLRELNLDAEVPETRPPRSGGRKG